MFCHLFKQLVESFRKRLKRDHLILSFVDVSLLLFGLSSCLVQDKEGNLSCCVLTPLIQFILCVSSSFDSLRDDVFGLWVLTQNSVLLL